jgi:ADP-ribose pyrophosphatase YjhB (NUDIX family)
MDDSEIVLQVGVKILLKNPEGKYLLMRSNPKKYPEKGARWDIVGGRINPGATLIENLKREVLEESSLELKAEPQLIAAQDILRVPGRHVVRLTYVGTISGEPVIDEESTEWKWFVAKEIKALTFEELDVYFKELVDTGVIVLE